MAISVFEKNINLLREKRKFIIEYIGKLGTIASVFKSMVHVPKI